MVYNTVISIVQQEDDADDLTQEVFIQVHQSIGSFKGESKFSTWLYKIAISKALDHEKKWKRKKRFAFVQSLFGNASDEIIHPPDFNHPGVLTENKERGSGIDESIKKIAQ